MDLITRFKLWYNTQPPAIRLLLTINVVLYLMWNLLFIHIEPAIVFTMRYLALTPLAETLLLAPWQLVTYNFLHTSPGFGGLLHILFNMLWLVWIGRDHEHLHGSANLMGLYLLGGIGGGLMAVLLHTALPSIGAFGGPIVGASGSVLAVIAAVATRYPNKSIALLFIGVVPLRLIVIGFLFLDLLFIASSGTAVGAHLGGAVAGFAIARLQLAGRDVTSWANIFFGGSRPRKERSPKKEDMLGQLESWLAERQEGRRKSRGESTPEPGGGAKRPRRREAKIHKLDPRAGERNPQPSGDELIDRLLDKINEHGYESLTEEEKRILYEASNK